MAPSTFAWRWQGRSVAVAHDTVGDGAVPLLCLPAFSTVSTRDELRPLAALLAGEGFRCTLLEWPGFGDSDRLPLDYGPALVRAFLGGYAETLDVGCGIVACGHAAGYALDLARARPGQVRALVLVAPTWRGRCRPPWGSAAARPSPGSAARCGCRCSGTRCTARTPPGRCCA